MIFKINIICAFVILLTSFGCKDTFQSETPRIEMSKMIDVMADVHLAEVAAKDSSDVTKRGEVLGIYYADICRRYNISKEDLQQSMKAYQDNPYKAKELYINVRKKLESMRKPLK